MKNYNNKNRFKWLLYLIFSGFLIKFFRFVFFKLNHDNRKKIKENFKNFFKKEKKEAQEFVDGKESFKEYCEDSGLIFKNYFIPSSRNDFKPKILRTKSLVVITGALLCLKIAVTGYLFFVYPNLARMSAVIQDEIYGLINIEREDNGIAPLIVSDKLNRTAEKKAEDMINKNYFAHKSPDGKMIWDMINRDEYPYLYVGENLAMNFTSARSAHKALMLSPTHKKNILNSKYTEVGVAVVSGEINNKKTNILVQVFAYPKPVKPALAMEAAPKQKITPVPPAKEKEEPPVKPAEPAPVAVNNPKPAVKPDIAIKDAKPAVKPVAAESKVLSAENEIDNKEISADAKEPIIAEYENEKTIEQSPNKELEAMASAKETKIEIQRQYGAAAKAINYSRYIFIGALILLILLLLVNILIRASIQHKPVIIQTLLVIIFTYGLITVKFHFLEHITEKILVM